MSWSIKGKDKIFAPFFKAAVAGVSTQASLTFTHARTRPSNVLEHQLDNPQSTLKMTLSGQA